MGSAGGIGDVRTFRVGAGLSAPIRMAAVMTVLLLAGFASAASGPSRQGAVPSTASPSDFETQPNGNFSIWIPQPTGTVVPGSYILAEFSLALATPSSDLPPTVNVWVPETSATFSLTNVSVRMFHPAFLLNFTHGGPTVSNESNLTTLLKFTAEFNTSALAILSSQLAAVMTNVPYGSITLTASWRWAIAYPDGMTVFGDWSAPTSFEPAEYATLTSFGPTTLVPGGNFQVCISAPEAGRQFSLHLETAVPYDDFVQVNQTVTQANSTTCWVAAVADWVTPQVILAHVWNYDRVTLLLYIIKVTVVNQTAGWTDVFTPLENWNALATIGALGLGAGLVVWGAHRVRPKRPHEPTVAECEP
jgi:hypothetical protein